MTTHDQQQNKSVLGDRFLLAVHWQEQQRTVLGDYTWVRTFTFWSLRWRCTTVADSISSTLPPSSLIIVKANVTHTVFQVILLVRLSMEECNEDEMMKWWMMKPASSCYGSAMANFAVNGALHYSEIKPNMLVTVKSRQYETNIKVLYDWVES